MENGAIFYVCVSAWCFAPILALVLGIQIGAGKIRLPFRVRIERAEPEEFVGSIE